MAGSARLDDADGGAMSTLGWFGIDGVGGIPMSKLGDVDVMPGSDEVGGGYVLVIWIVDSSMIPAAMSACAARSAQRRARRGANGMSAIASSATFWYRFA